MPATAKTGQGRKQKPETELSSCTRVAQPSPAGPQGAREQEGRMERRAGVQSQALPYGILHQMLAPFLYFLTSLVPSSRTAQCRPDLGSFRTGWKPEV